MSITELSIKRPLLITVIFFTLILFGLISYKNLNYNLLPKFEANVVVVLTSYRGASAEEVQNTVTKPIEDIITSIEGVDKISSVSQEGASMITVQLKPGINTITAQRDAERKINQIKALLPPDADDPVVNRFNTDEIPVLRISASANVSNTELFELVDGKIKPLISNVEGVGSVRLIGGNEREIQVELDNQKLQAYNVSVTQVNQAIASANSSVPAGNVESKENKLSLRLDAKISKVEELRNIVVGQNRNGSRILLKDVATVTDAQSEIKTLCRTNGKGGIGIEIVKQGDANAVKVSELVKKKLEDLKTQYKSKNLTFQIAIDQSVYTLASADAVMHDLFLAVIIVAFVMLLFLHSFRSSLFVLVALPSAMIPTFILMYAFGFSLNLMTLMALSLVVGILVDDSIVVLENIFRHLEMGKSKVQAAIDGRSEIGFTAIAITLVDVVVFVPMALSGGMIGNILREFSLVVVLSTLMSLVVSFTLTPLLASRWAKLEVLSKATLWGRLNLAFENFLDALKEEYGKILRWSLSHKRYVFGLIIVLFVMTGFLMKQGFIGTAFVAQSDRGEIGIQLELSSQTPLKTTNQVALKAEKLLLSRPEVVNVFTSVGTQSAAMGGSSSNTNMAEISIKLVEKNERTMSADAFGALMRDEISKIPGVKVSVRPIGITGGSEAPIQIAVKGTDMDEIWKVAKHLKEVVAKTPGTDYVAFSTKTPKAEIEIKLDREKMSALGLSVPEVGTAIQLAFRGNNQTKYKEAGEEYGINLTMNKSDKQDIENVKNLIVRTNKGANIQLKEIAQINETLGQSVLERSDRLNSIKVTASAVGRPAGTIVDDIKKEIEKTKLPESVMIDFQGEAQRQKEAFGNLGMAMLLGFVLVYLIMVALYESVVYPFVVLFSIPVAIVGSITALALSMQPLSIFAIVGLIMLLGLVAKNGILIVDFANHLKSEGMSLTESLVEAGKERLRPILMTTIAMIAGMLPIALSTGSGAEVKNGMAWVIIGGLTSSLVLTLVLIPSVYYVMEKLILRTRKLLGFKNPENHTLEIHKAPKFDDVEVRILDN